MMYQSEMDARHRFSPRSSSGCGLRGTVAHGPVKFRAHVVHWARRKRFAFGERAQCSENVIAGAEGEGVCGISSDRSGHNAIVEHRAVIIPVVASVRNRDAVRVVVSERDLREVGEAATSGSLGGRAEHDDSDGHDSHLLRPFQDGQHAMADGDSRRAVLDPIFRDSVP